MDDSLCVQWFRLHRSISCQLSYTACDICSCDICSIAAVHSRNIKYERKCLTLHSFGVARQNTKRGSLCGILLILLIPLITTLYCVSCVEKTLVTSFVYKTNYHQ
ncbi:hypothetical protein NP493_2224g00011 [Ridgeia piscesae]|uniref:Uncharacterized protein n=1 Tax=Ridgeia piscesae TaxID=27915 RepID=A0AAD9JJB7_RIDPI|nr:hypothetical protein NP493_2224g00011 [Ridgeia piscesae]